MFFQFYFRKHYSGGDSHDGHLRKIYRNLVEYPDRDWGVKKEPQDISPAPTPLENIERKEHSLRPLTNSVLPPRYSEVCSGILEVKKELERFSKTLTEESALRKFALEMKLKHLQDEEELLILLIIDN